MSTSELRKQSWATRRAKYGPSGHSGGAYYTAHRNGSAAKKMFDLLIRLHAEGVLSEGQIAKATEVDRLSIRGARQRFLSAQKDKP